MKYILIHPNFYSLLLSKQVLTTERLKPPHRIHDATLSITEIASFDNMLFGHMLSYDNMLFGQKLTKEKVNNTKKE